MMLWTGSCSFKWLFSPCLYWLQHHYNRSERAAFLINWWDMSKKQHSIDNVYIVILILLLSASFSRVLWGPLPLWRCIIILSLTFFLKMSNFIFVDCFPKNACWKSCLQSQTNKVYFRPKMCFLVDLFLIRRKPSANSRP